MVFLPLLAAAMIPALLDFEEDGLDSSISTSP